MEYIQLMIYIETLLRARGRVINNDPGTAGVLTESSQENWDVWHSLPGHAF